MQNSFYTDMQFAQKSSRFLFELKRKICLAPMLAYTDKHFRYLLRLMTKHLYLYTEMITTGALLHAKQEKILSFAPIEHPIAIQLAGSNPKELALCAKIVEDAGFNEINLNVGCPSSRVQAGKFGAALIKEPGLVAECIDNMRQKVTIPITVKTRLGIVGDSYEKLKNFIALLNSVGTTTFIIHARFAELEKYSPKENRNLQPVNYTWVYDIKKDFPDLEIIINGNIKTTLDIKLHLESVDGVMIGRAAYANPYFFANIDNIFFNDNNNYLSRFEIIEKYLIYLENQINAGANIRFLIKPLFNIFYNTNIAKSWRRFLTENINNISAQLIAEYLHVQQQ